MQRPFTPGDIIDDAYEAEECIGQGGFGFVYRARQLSMDRDVALKVLSSGPDMPDSSAERFRREVLAVRKLTHPNTVRIYDFSETESGLLYYTMEYLTGDTLEERVADSGPLAPRTVRDILVQVLNSLAEAHGHGIVHRDLKPANLMLVDYAGESNFVKVLDFGIAKAMKGDGSMPDASLTAAGKIVGTLRYMAPEQAAEGEIGAYTDIYALSLVAVELLTGHTVLEDMSSLELIQTHTSESPIQLPGAINDIPLGDVIRTGLAKRPADRYAAADEMRAALEAIDADQLPDHAVVTGPTEDTVTMDIPAISEESADGGAELGRSGGDPGPGPNAVSPEATPTQPQGTKEQSTSSPLANLGLIQYAILALAVSGLLAAGVVTWLSTESSAASDDAATAGAVANESDGPEKPSSGPEMNEPSAADDKPTTSEVVTVATDGPEATVFHDASRFGTTPLEFEVSDPTRIRLEADGYATKIVEIRPEDGERRTIELSPSETDDESESKEDEPQRDRSAMNRENTDNREASGKREGPDPETGGSETTETDDSAETTGSRERGEPTASTDSTSDHEAKESTSSDDDSESGWAPIPSDDESEDESPSSDESAPSKGDGSDGSDEESEVPVF